jgi:hypothetical protein
VDDTPRRTVKPATMNLGQQYDDQELPLSQQSDSGSEIDLSQEVILTWSVAKVFQVPFGRYKGKLLKNMLKSKKRRDYLRYLLKWDDLRDNTKDNITCALQHYTDTKTAASVKKEKLKKPKKGATQK